MNCQEFTFLHASGQMDEAGWLTRLRAEPHRLVCQRCRDFADNNAKLSIVLYSYQQKLKQLEPTPPRYSEPNSQHLSRF